MNHSDKNFLAMAFLAAALITLIGLAMPVAMAL